MAARHFFIQCALAVLLLVLSNLAVRQLAVNSVPRQILKSAQESPPASDLFLGNSTMAAGVDEGAFTGGDPLIRPLNLGLGSSSPVEHYLLYRQQHQHRGADVYYGFLDTQLTDQPRGDWSDLVGNRALVYYVEPDTARELYSFRSSTQGVLFQLTSHVPMLVERLSIWAKVERLRRVLQEIGMPKLDTNRFGRAEDFSALELKQDDFIARCNIAVANRTPLNRPISSLFDDVHGAGSQLYVVEMPMPAHHHEQFYNLPSWKAYRQYLQTKIEEGNGVYVNASRWVGDEGFSDSLHLNSHGAKQFSQRLGRWVREQQHRSTDN